MSECVATKPQSLKGRKNIYTCTTCGGHIVTVDVDDGVTPFMVRCKMPNCGGNMQSSMYRVFDQNIRAWWEWYKPSAIEVLTPAERRHVDRGGLLLRRASADGSAKRQDAAGGLIGEADDSAAPAGGDAHA